MLLYLTLSPSFFLTHPLASTSTAFFPLTSANQALDVARQSPAFRRGVVSALQATLEQGLGGAGLEEKAVEVWRRGANDSDDQVRLVALQGLARFGGIIHPVLPPQQPNSTFARIRHEQRGGFVGDEEDYQETAEAFRLRVEPVREAHEDEEQRMHVEEKNAAAARQEEEEERRRKTTTAAAAQEPSTTAFKSATTTTFSASSFAAPPPVGATSSSAAPSFSAFAAPAFGSAALPAAAEAVPTESTSTFKAVEIVAPSSFIESSTSANRDTQTTKAAETEKPLGGAGRRDGKDSDADDDVDDEMPAIDLGGSDEEE
jgi:hypothetical protein